MGLEIDEFGGVLVELWRFKGWVLMEFLDRSLREERVVVSEWERRTFFLRLWPGLAHGHAIPRHRPCTCFWSLGCFWRLTEARLCHLCLSLCHFMGFGGFGLARPCHHMHGSCQSFWSRGSNFFLLFASYSDKNLQNK